MGKKVRPLNGYGFPFKVMKVFWNYIQVVVAEHVTVPISTELHTLKRLILCYVNLVPIKKCKTNKKNPPGSLAAALCWAGFTPERLWDQEPNPGL